MRAHVSRETLCRGPAEEICVLRRGARCQIVDFIESLEQKEKKKLLALLKRVCEEGVPRNPQKYRRFGSGVKLDEIKSYQVRVLLFRDDDGAMVLTNAWLKKRGSQLSREIERALRLREEYMAGRSEGAN